MALKTDRRPAVCMYEPPAGGDFALLLKHFVCRSDIFLQAQ